METKHPRFLTLSDLHLEFAKHSFDHALRSSDYDAVILAGDIGVGLMGIGWAMKSLPCDKPVFFVMGNHERYGQRTEAKLFEKALRKTEGSNIRVLENEAVEFMGVLIFGCTLWTDYELLGDKKASMAKASAEMNDHAKIFKTRRGPISQDAGLYDHGSAPKRTGDRMTPRDCEERHWKSRGLISNAIDRSAETAVPLVVVSHHAPHPLSVPESESSHLDGSYASDLSHLMGLPGSPVLWVHGHTHRKNDYRVLGTRVFSNPKGYPGKQANPDFNPQAVVQVSSIALAFEAEPPESDTQTRPLRP